jgi:hypothetical protein
MARISKRPKVGTENGTSSDTGRIEELESTIEQSTSSVNDGSLSNGGGDDSSDSIEPASIPDNGDTSGKRQRKPRSDRGTRRSGRSRKSENQDAKDLTAILYSLHLMAANIVKIEELALTEDESEQLALAIARVNEVYSGIVLPEKVVVWVNLAIACGSVYGPRIMAYNLRKKSEPKTIDGEIVH